MKTSRRVSALGAMLAGAAALAGAGLAAAAGALSVDDIIQLELAGVSEETILQVVELEGAVFRLSVAEIIDLREAGASDDLIRALMDTAGAVDRPAYREEYHYHYDNRGSYGLGAGYGFDNYSVIFASYYYDPFAYHWYAWPRLYVYYAPFWWCNAGIYYAGWWSRDWWDPWGPCAWHCDSYYGFGHHFGPSQSRVRAGRTWHRSGSAAGDRMDREQRIWRRAGLSAPAQPQASARRVRSADRPTPYGAGEVRREGRTVRRDGPAPVLRGQETPRRTARAPGEGRIRSSEKGIQPSAPASPAPESTPRAPRGERPAYRQSQPASPRSTSPAPAARRSAAASSQSSSPSSGARAHRR